MIRIVYLYKRFFLPTALLSLFFFVESCENDTNKINELTRNVVMKEEAKDVVSYLSEGGIMKAKLTAPLMYRVLADTVYVEFPKTLHVDFYNDSGKVETRLDSKYGKYLESLDKVYLKDSVVVINVQGDTLRSPDLWWDQDKKIFYTDQVAQYHTKDKQIAGGKGLEATQDLKNVTFKSPTGTVLFSDSSLSK